MTAPSSDLGSTARVFAPRRWRAWAAWIIVALVAVIGISSAVVLTDGPVLAWIRGLAWVFVLPLPLYASAMARSVTVEPGVAISFRTWFFAARSVPIDATTEIVSFSAVAGSTAGALDPRARPKRSPIGVIDQKWAVLRTQGSTVLRLSMHSWTPGQLLEVAMAAPAQLRLRPEPVTVDEVQRQYPDYYAAIERRPVLEGWVLGIVLLLASLAILIGAGSVFSLADTLWPAPRG